MPQQHGASRARGRIGNVVDVHGRAPHVDAGRDERVAQLGHEVRRGICDGDVPDDLSRWPDRQGSLQLECRARRADAAPRSREPNARAAWS